MRVTSKLCRAPGSGPPGTEFDTPVLVSLFNFFMVIYIFQLYLFIYLLYVYHDVTPDCICTIFYKY